VFCLALTSDVGGALRIANAWALLGLLVAILAVAAWGLWSWLRHRRGSAAREASPLSCPTCRRGYPAGTIFCSVDGARLVGVPPPSRAGRCPRCQRTFPAGIRFCPADGEELHAQAEWRGELEAPASEADHDHLVSGDGKICPVCASHYALEAQVCGRDGSELVTIN
jgi:RNA polymerase subunit RPABC4/transcription elongation factor Spt4